MRSRQANAKAGDGEPDVTPLKSRSEDSPGLHVRKAIKTIIDAAERASRWLWIKRGDLWTTQATQTPEPDQPLWDHLGEGV